MFIVFEFRAMITALDSYNSQIISVKFNIMICTCYQVLFFFVKKGDVVLYVLVSL